MKKNILFVLHLPPPVHGQGMVGSFIKNSQKINEHFNCTYINLSTSTTVESVGKNSIGKYFTLLKIAFKVIKCLLTTKYDLCYMTPASRTPPFYKDFVIILLLKFFNCKIVYHFHNKGIADCSQSSINRALYKFAFKNEKVILLSQLVYPDIAAFVKPADVYICANGIPDQGNAIVKQIPDVGAFCKLLFVSNLVIDKGVVILLEACKLLKHRGLKFKCDFVGDWAEISPEQFNDIVKDMGLTGMVFAHGKKYKDEKLAYLTNADIFILPTYYNNENFPLVILEAMSFNLPVISTNVAGIPEMVMDGETGYIIAPQDPEQLADRLTTLINNQQLQLKMGQAARKRFEERFTVETFESRMTDILQTV